MVSTRLLLVFGLSLLPLVFSFVDGNPSYLILNPQNPVVEFGTDFTATCSIIHTKEITADDLCFTVGDSKVSAAYYKKINATTLSVTFPVRTEKTVWLLCKLKNSDNIFQQHGKFVQGIHLKVGYVPKKPENLTCLALQDDRISPILTCHWNVLGRQTVDVSNTYTLFVSYGDKSFNQSTPYNNMSLSLGTYPNHMSLEIWVEAKNELGMVSSDILRGDANCFTKPNPPYEEDMRVIAEKSFSSSLLFYWTHPLKKDLSLFYQIRYCPDGSPSWSYVSSQDTSDGIESFRLQGLRPYTDYVIQIRCKHLRNEDCGYWSNWSVNLTSRTPESTPESPPDLWFDVVKTAANDQQVSLISKIPKKANGKIIAFDVTLHFPRTGKSDIHVNVSESQLKPTDVVQLTQFVLTDEDSVRAVVAASNLEGQSPKLHLSIPWRVNKRCLVKDLKVWSNDGQLYLDWTTEEPSKLSEFIIEWRKDVDDGHSNISNWQRQSRNVQNATIKDLEPFVCYNICVYAVCSNQVMEPGRVQAFLEEGVPLKGPIVRLMDYPGYSEAKLVWAQIPWENRRGFITNYTLFYKNAKRERNVTLPGNSTSYVLKNLKGNTRYDVWMDASTKEGKARGPTHSFTTTKYESIERTVVGVSLGFLFVVLIVILLCVYKKDIIKENFWPQIPDPGESTIGTWSPDYPSKTEPPKENSLCGISVMDVGACDTRRVFEEDKSSLSLKKDKYLSEEHSSGIGGSSCMSSPRQSVSDSDEGADMADTTASTVQYSSVMAPSCYKGQTPAAVFSRSESTQPLLDSEENPDMSMQDASLTGNPDSFQLLEEEQADFSPSEEPTTESDKPSTEPSASSYMPQLGATGFSERGH